MPDLCRILDFIPLKWRYTTAATIPLLIGLGLYFVVGWVSIVVSSVLSVTSVWLLGHRQTRFFLRTASGIIRTRSIDRRNRLSAEGPLEQQRIINAVNRLADSVEQTLFEANRDRRYHEMVLNEVPVGILVVDAEGMLQYANLAACSLLGFEVQSRISMPAPLASRVNIYEINEAVAASAINRETIHRTIELYDAHRHLDIFSRPLPPDDSGIMRAILIITDRTEEMRLAVMMKEFVANASHELRTPIASIQASVDTLKLGANLKPEATAQFLDRIDDSAQRMATLVTELMDLALLESGRSPLNLQMTDPKEIISSALDSHGPARMSSDHEIAIEVEDGVSSVLVDKQKMERAIGNLLLNARKFTPPGGKITIGCQQQDESAVFTIVDTGEGIDPEEIPHIFGRFYKSRRSTNDRTGFGLGLAITKNIVELHNGSVYAESVIGVGSTFTVRLPLS